MQAMGLCPHPPLSPGGHQRVSLRAQGLCGSSPLSLGDTGVFLGHLIPGGNDTRAGVIPPTPPAPLSLGHRGALIQPKLFWGGGCKSLRRWGGVMDGVGANS